MSLRHAYDMKKEREMKELLTDCRAPIEALWDCTCDAALLRPECERCELLRRIDEALS